MSFNIEDAIVIHRFVRDYTGNIDNILSNLYPHHKVFILQIIQHYNLPKRSIINLIQVLDYDEDLDFLHHLSMLIKDNFIDANEIFYRGGNTMLIDMSHSYTYRLMDILKIAIEEDNPELFVEYFDITANVGELVKHCNKYGKNIRDFMSIRKL